MNRIRTAALALACVLPHAAAASLAPIPALADVVAAAPVVAAPDPATVVIPYGEQVVGFLHLAQEVLVPLLVGVVMTAVAKVAPWATLFLSQKRVEDMVQNVANYGINAVDGALKGKQLSVPVGSAVIAQAVQRAIDAAPKKVLDAAGGPSGLAERVFRTLHLDENATVESVLGPVFAQVRAGEVGKGAK